ncbi:MAG: HEAT repeat domain-containing protein, partial [Planctomycetes bacterium]|nr:HEAT repeat domain-containing protein [Planctomycetota bacterium]
PDVAVRRHAVVTLGKLGPLAADAVPKLKRLADDPDQEVRALAASALGLIRA